MIWSTASDILQLVPSETGALTLCSPNYFFLIAVVGSSVILQKISNL